MVFKRLANFNLEAVLLQPIEDARHAHNLANRTAAINFLIRRGLEAEGIAVPAADSPNDADAPGP